MSHARAGRELTRGEFYLERANEHDLLAVVEVEESSGLSRWGWDAYRAELERPEAIMLVARSGVGAGGAPAGAVVGFVAARVNGDELHVNNIGVRREERGHGVGKALLGAALRAGRSLGARTATLEVRAANRVAHALYAGHGFRVVGRRRNYYRHPTDDALVMRAVLRAES